MAEVRVRCINNEGYPVSLARGKVYTRLQGVKERAGLVRVIDESGEDYLYPARRFESVTDSPSSTDDRSTTQGPAPSRLR